MEKLYHIPNDRRAFRSADRIYDSLMECLQHKTFPEISISSLERSGISRATFYRLFDNLSDVLEWKCEVMMSDAISRAVKGENNSFSAVLLSFITSITENHTLISALASNSKSYILYDLHMRHMEEIEGIFFKGMKLDEVEGVCISSLLSSMLPALCNLSLMYPESTAEELLSYLKAALSRLDGALRN